jgi:hypothetical protein
MESAGFNDKAWLDASGRPHREALRAMERYQRRDFGPLDVKMTLAIKFTQDLPANSDIFGRLFTWLASVADLSRFRRNSSL